MSPLAIIMPSATRRMAAQFSTPCMFSILAMILMPSPLWLCRILRISRISSAVLVKDAATVISRSKYDSLSLYSSRIVIISIFLSLVSLCYLPLYTIPCSASIVTNVPDFSIFPAFLAATITGMSSAMPTIAAWL